MADAALLYDGRLISTVGGWVREGEVCEVSEGRVVRIRLTGHRRQMPRELLDSLACPGASDAAQQLTRACVSYVDRLEGQGVVGGRL